MRRSDPTRDTFKGPTTTSSRVVVGRSVHHYHSRRISALEGHLKTSRVSNCTYNVSTRLLRSNRALCVSLSLTQVYFARDNSTPRVAIDLFTSGLPNDRRVTFAVIPTQQAHIYILIYVDEASAIAVSFCFPPLCVSLSLCLSACVSLSLPLFRTRSLNVEGENVSSLCPTCVSLFTTALVLSSFHRRTQGVRARINAVLPTYTHATAR